MKHRHHFSRQRPPWWPENEEWPPKRWQYMRGKPFFRRMGCFFFGFSFLAFVGLLGILRLVLAPFIDFHGSPPLERPDFIFPLGLAGFLILMSVIFWGARTLRRMSMPLDDLLDASNRVAEGDYSVRVEAKGPPEIYSLMRGFNSMTERLQANDRQRRNMLADVSHELRTPLTVIQGNVEGILDGVYQADETRLKSILEETQVLSRLIEDLRTLSLAESGALQLKREPIDLGELLRDAVAGFEAQAKEKEIKLGVSLIDIGEINIDPQRVREVLTNLISNALRYTPVQGEVNVTLAESASSTESDALSGETVSKRGVTISIHDSGSGIEAADLPHIFDRFYKSSDSGGMGLGLSIAKYLVEAHGGKIWAETSTQLSPGGEAGTGTKISFTLPMWVR